MSGTSAAGTLGPDLSHVGSRSTIGAATLPNDPAGMTRWLADTQGSSRAPKMPTLDLTDEQIAALVAYLERCRRVTRRRRRPRAHRAGLARSPGLLGFFTTVDHKRLGIRYIVTSFVFFFVAGLLALVMRAQLARPNGDVVGPDAYNQLFTMHGTMMIFLFNTPVLAGFGNYLVPLLIGARDMAFPRLNAFSYWIFVGAGIFMSASMVIGKAPDGGWFAYVPLTGKAVLARDQPRLLGARRDLRRHLDDRRCGQLPRHRVQAARPGDDRQPHPDPGVVVRGDGVHDPVRRPGDHRVRRAARSRPVVRHEVLRRRRAAATRCCTSTCSGSGAIPRCTSCSSPPSAW